MRALVLAVLVAACAPTASPPYDANVPAGGTVIYRAPSSRYGLYGMPVRIVQVGEACVVETWNGESWGFASSGPCDVRP